MSCVMNIKLTLFKLKQRHISKLSLYLSTTKAAKGQTQFDNGHNMSMNTRVQFSLQHAAVTEQCLINVIHLNQQKCFTIERRTVCSDSSDTLKMNYNLQCSSECGGGYFTVWKRLLRSDFKNAALL